MPPKQAQTAMNFDGLGWLCWALAVGVDALNQRLQHGIGLVVGDLAGARRSVAGRRRIPASARPRGFGCCGSKSIARGQHGVLLLCSPHITWIEIPAVGKQRVNHEAVHGPDGFFAAQVQAPPGCCAGWRSAGFVFGARPCSRYSCTRSARRVAAEFGSMLWSRQ